MMKPRRITWSTGEEELAAITGINSKEYRAHLSAGLAREDWQGYEELRVPDAGTAYRMRRSGVPDDLETSPLEGLKPGIMEFTSYEQGVHVSKAGSSRTVNTSVSSSIPLHSSLQMGNPGSEAEGSIYTVPKVSPNSFAAVPLSLIDEIPHAPYRLFLVLIWHARLKGARRLQTKRRHYELAGIHGRGHRANARVWLEKRGLIRVHRRARQMPEIELAPGPKGMPGRWPRIVTERGERQ